MKIEAGKYYKTGGGRKVYVSAIIEPSPFPGKSVCPTFPILGYVDMSGDSQFQSWASDGSFYGGLSGDKKDDLVSEWREPVKRELVVRLFRGNDGAGTFTCISAETAIMKESPGLIAIKTVTITEGEGMR